MTALKTLSAILKACCLTLLLSATVQAVQEQGSPIELAKSYTVQSEILQQARTINVYLPPSYGETKKSYPVLYLLDGGIHQDFTHIAGIASLAADFRNIREFILIGISGIDRYHELIHPSTVEQDRERLPTSGGAAKFREYLTSELKPYVQKNYRVTDETVLIGESAAGLFVTETFLRQPDLFDGYVAVSPMLWWDNQSLAKSAVSLLQQNQFPDRNRLYVTIANEGGTMREGVDIFVEALKQHAPKTVNWTFVPMEQETHGTTFHPVALAAVRKFFALDAVPSGN